MESNAGRKFKFCLLLSYTKLYVHFEPTKHQMENAVHSIEELDLLTCVFIAQQMQKFAKRKLFGGIFFFKKKTLFNIISV